MSNVKLSNEYEEYEFSHIPSALSHYYYLKYIFKNNLVIPYNHNIVLGKPYGSLAYLYIWKKFNLKPTNVITNNIDFINYFDPTAGNSLGFASGLELGNKKQTWVNISDAQLSNGNIYEAVRFIGIHRQNIKLTIDYNNVKLISNLLQSKESIKQLFISNGWSFLEIKNKEDFFMLGNMFNLNGPFVALIHTKKGFGIKEMEENPVLYHYKKLKLKDLNAFTISQELEEDGLFDSCGYVQC